MRNFSSMTSLSVFFALLLVAGTAHAGSDYSGPLPAGCFSSPGTITSTCTITSNTQLNGNVMCNMTSAEPCIAFGASNISLKLNGHTITGQGMSGANRGNPCSSSPSGDETLLSYFEYGIWIPSGQNNVRIVGPGLIGEFRDRGIEIDGNNSLVSGVVVSSTCREGIALFGRNNVATFNTVVRSSLSGGYYASIWLTGSGGHKVTFNIVGSSGPGPAQAGAESPPAPVGGQGIFSGSTFSPFGNNLIQGNVVTGIPGSGIFEASINDGYMATTGDKIIGNTVFGNVYHHDIYDNNPSGSNTYHDNVCEYSGGLDAPNVCPNLQP